MQNAETVLDVLRDRGRRGLPCTELYRQLFNPSLYELAHGRIYASHGAMTPGADGETADGMSPARTGCIIDAPGPTGSSRSSRFTSRRRAAVRHEARCCIVRAAGRDERRYLWI